MIHRNLRPLLLATIVSILGGCAAVPQQAPAVPTPNAAQAGNTTVVAVTTPAAPKQTLPEFLGITALCKLAGGGISHLSSRLGMMFPGLEPGPPLLAITDPANAGPNQPPAVQAAAEVKAEEEAAPQKVKALRFLAGVGCGGCYPDVEKSFLAALDDCTEVVRYEAVKALRSTAGNPCHFCRSDSCCSPTVLKKLSAIAYDMDSGCYTEPSARVRRMARLAMNACGGPVPIGNLAPEEGPAEELPAGSPATAANQNQLSFSAALAQLRSDVNPVEGTPVGFASHGAIAARVNGDPIVWSKIIARAATVPVESASTVSTPATSREDRIRAQLHRAIDNRLLSQEARRRMPPSEIQRVVYLTAAGRVRGEFTATNDDEILAGEWVKRSIYVSPNLSRQEIYEYYRANFERYREPGYVRWEQVSARFSRIPSHVQGVRALSYVRARILGDNSDRPVGLNLGVIESFSRETPLGAGLPKGEIGNALAVLSIGQTSAILQDAEGLHLVRVLERRESRTRPLDEVIDTVRKDLQQQRHSQLVEQHLQQLRGEADIWIAPRVQAAAEWPIDGASAPVAHRFPPVDAGPGLVR